MKSPTINYVKETTWAHTLRWAQFKKRLSAAGPGATLGVSGGSLKGSDDRVSLTGPRDPAPAALATLLQRMEKVK